MSGKNTQDRTIRAVCTTDIPGNGVASRLDGWKEIASHLGRSVRCVQRWERSLALPVHRIRHLDGYTVYAYVAELEAWQQSRDRVEPPVSRDEAPAAREGMALRNLW